MLADTPLANDRSDQLGFAAYADAVAGLLDHPDTDTPLTIAISAAWGAGKTSLANMVTRRLVDRPLQRGDRPHIICWFNAWLHDDAPHLGAAFAAEVAKTANRHRAWPRRLLSPLPSAMLNPEQRWRRRIVLGLGSLLVAVLVALSPGVRAAMQPGASVVDSIRTVFGQRWAPVALLALVGLAVWRKVFAAAQAAARFVDDPRSEAAGGSMQQVRQQLGKLIGQAVRNPGPLGGWLMRVWPAAARLVPRLRGERRRLVLVVDDLERCRPPRAVEVCEVASQLLGHPDVATILVADMATVATAAEIKYAALEAAPSHDDGAHPLQPSAKGAYGRAYLQKIVQLQFDLPPASPESLRGILTSDVHTPVEPEGGAPRTVRPWRAALERLTAWARRSGASGAAVAAVAAVGIAAAATAAVAGAGVQLWESVWSARRQRAARRVDEEIKARAGGEDDPASLKAAVLGSEAAREGGVNLAAQRFERFVADDSLWREQAESEALEFLPGVPRSAKRLANHLRLLLVVASERRMLGGAPQLEAAHLGKWIVLLERWPELGWAIRADPAVMGQLEEAAAAINDPGEPDLPTVVTAPPPR